MRRQRVKKLVRLLKSSSEDAEDCGAGSVMTKVWSEYSKSFYRGLGEELDNALSDNGVLSEVTRTFSTPTAPVTDQNLDTGTRYSRSTGLQFGSSNDHLLFDNKSGVRNSCKTGTSLRNKMQPRMS